MEFGWGADRDVTAAISFVLDQPGVTHGIGILGLSMGGEVGLTVAALDHRVGLSSSKVSPLERGPTPSVSRSRTRSDTSTRG